MCIFLCSVQNWVWFCACTHSVFHMDDVTGNMLGSGRCFLLSVNLRMCYFLLERGSAVFSEVRAFSQKFFKVQDLTLKCFNLDKFRRT